MSLFTDLKEVLTPYANRIKGLSTDVNKAKTDINTVKANLADVEEEIESGGSSGDSEIKEALFGCLSNVAWTSNYGKECFEILKEALAGREEEVWSGGSNDSGFSFRSGQFANDWDKPYNYTARRLSEIMPTRRCLLALTGATKRRLIDSDGESFSDFYYFQIPEDAYGIDISYSPASNYVAFQQIKTTGQPKVVRYGHDYGWKTGNGSVSLPVIKRTYLNNVKESFKVNAGSITYKLSNGGEISSNPTINYSFTDAFHTKKWAFNVQNTNANGIIHVGNLVKAYGQGARKRTGVGAAEEPAVVESNLNRTSFWVDTGRKGQKSVVDYDTVNRKPFYAIPIPDNATAIDVVATPSTCYVTVNVWAWKESDDIWALTSAGVWVMTQTHIDMPALPSGYDHAYMTVTCKYNAAGSSGDEPTGIDITFS